MHALLLLRTTHLAIAASLLAGTGCAAGGASPTPPAASPASVEVAEASSPAPSATASPAVPSQPSRAPAPAPLSGGSARVGTPPPQPPSAAGAKTADTAPHAAQEEMLVYTGQLDMQTDDGVAATIDRIIDVAESIGGRITGRSDASVVVSVPSAHFREAMTRMEPLGVVTHRSVSAQDVTEQFHDVEVRLQNLRATRQRLQEFLAKAGNVADTLTVEHELERVAQEIDVLEGKMRFLKERAAFSEITVGVTARPKVVVTPEPPPPPPPPPPPQRLLELPIAWFSSLGIDRLLDLR